MLQEIPVPLMDKASRDRIAEMLRGTVTQLRSSTEARTIATKKLDDALDVDNDWAQQRLRAAKPPK